MNRLTKLMYALIVATSSLLLAIPASAQPDSFFDVFFDIDVRSDPTDPLELMGEATFRKDGGETRTVDIEILSMDLTSSAGPTDSTGGTVTRHNAVVKYLVTNIGSSGEDGVRRAVVDIICDPNCRVVNSKGISRGKHRRK